VFIKLFKHILLSFLIPWSIKEYKEPIQCSG